MTLSSLLRLWLSSGLFLISFAVSSAGLEAGPNKSPRADAGPGKSATVGEVVTLDASGSTDTDGDWLSFRWTLKTPSGSGAKLNDAGALRPRFTVDLLGDYTAELIVNDGKLDSVADAVTIRTANVAPVAIADWDRTVSLGETVMLDGSQSWDFNGDLLDYQWSLVEAPVGSRAQLQSARSVRPVFATDIAGDYVFELTVSDGQYRSKATQMRLTTLDTRPRADAGPDRNTYAGTRIRLDGRESTDADGAPLTYRWNLLHAPDASPASLSGADTATPFISIDAPGLYLVQLIVNDGIHQGEPDTIVIAATGQPLLSPNTVVTRGGGQDVDGDGIPDDSDNCAEDFNPSQLDSNGDGFGNQCDADLDNDGFITNFGDLAILRGVFFTTPISPNWNPDADFNGDNVVNFLDLQVMREAFFGPPGPIVNRFIDPAGGSWHEADNWSLGIVPNQTHTVRIDIGDSVSVEYSTGINTIGGLRSTTDFAISGGTLRVNGNMQVNAGFSVSGSGILADANILAPTTQDEIVIPASASFTFENVTLGADVTIETGASLYVDDDLTLSGATITLASDNASTYLRFRGVSGASSTLGGTGDVVFGGTTTFDNRNNVEVFNSTDGLVVGAGVTIRNGATSGQVYHRFNNGPVTIQGTVISDLPGRTISLSGSPLTIEGTLQGLNGGNLTLTLTGTGSTFTGTATMDINGGVLALYGSWTSSATITVTDGLLDISTNNTDAWDNDGTITLTNSIAELGGRFAAADVGTLSTTGDVIINGTLDNNGQSFNAGSDLPGNVLLGAGGEIEAGSVVTTPLTVLTGVSFTFDSVTLGADVTIEPGASLYVDDDLTLSGATITLASDNASTYLRFRGVSGATSTLGGTGDVVFGGTTTFSNRNNVEVFNSTDGLVIGPGVTIRSGTAGGQVYHRFNNGPVTVQGTVISNLPGSTVAVSGSPLTIEGTLQGLNGGNLTLTPAGTGSSFAGTATMSDGGTLLFNAAAATVWSIAGPMDVNGGELALYGSWTSTATITVTDGLLDIGNSNTGAWDNDGTITLTNSTAELGGRFAAADVGTLSTTGDVIINGTLDNNGQSFNAGSDLPGNVLLGAGGEIEAGSVVTTPLTVLTGVSFTFDSVTLGADVTIEPGASLYVDDDLTLSGATITLASDNASTYLRFRGVSGATSTLGGTGEVVFGGTTTFDNRNNVEVFNSTDGLVVGAGVTIRSGTAGGQVYHRFNNGAVTIQGTALSNLAARTITVSGVPLTIDGTLQGLNGGNLTLTPAGTGSSFTGTATMSDGGTLLFNAAAATVWSIAGPMDVNGGELALYGSWTSTATITVTDGLLDIGNSNTGAWDNDGTITLTNSTAELGGRFAAADVGTLSTTGDVIINGTLDNNGQSFNAGSDLPGNVLLGAGGEIEAGSVVTTPLTVLTGVSFTFDSVTLGADVTIEPGASLYVDDDLTLSGATITLASDNASTYLRFRGVSGASSTLGGTGEVVFGGTTTFDNRNNVEVFNSTDGLVVGAGVTIRSGTAGGQVYHRFNNGAVTIQGTALSNLAARTITVSGVPLTIDGTLQGLNGGNLTLTPAGTGSSFTGTATMSDGGTLLFNAAAATVWSIAGSMDVNGSELALYGSWTSTATITVTDGLLDIGNSNTGAWDNDGTITLTNSTVELGGRFAAADVGTLSTTGDVIINGTLDNNGQSFNAGSDLPGNVLLGAGGEIEAGSVITTPLTVLSGISFTLDNVTLGADVTIEPGASLYVDDDLTLSGATVTLASDNASTYLRFRGVSGASSTLGGTGEVVFGGTTTFDNRNNVEVFNSTDGLVVGAGVTIRSGTAGGQVYHRFNNGAVTIQGTALSNLAARTITVSGVPLTIDGTLQGLNGGNLTLTPAGTGSSFTGTATMSDGGTLLFNAAAATVWSIAGSMDVNGSELALYGSWTSTATITVTDGLLDIGNSNTGAWDNDGTITLTNSTVELGGRFAAADVGTLSTTGDVIINGTLDNNGQSFNAGSDLPGNVLLGAGGEIEAGSVITTPLTVLSGISFTLDNVTLGADVTIEPGASLYVDDDLTLSGATVTLASDNASTYLRFRGVSGASSTLGGTGEVVFGGTTTFSNRNNVEVFNSTDGLVIGPGVTIRSGTAGGQVYHRFNNGAVTIQGTVLSNLAARTITVSGVPLSIEGNLQTGAGSVINFTSDYSLTATATLDVEIGGTATTEFGRFTAAGRTANLDGTVNMTLVNAFMPVLNDTFEILTFTGRDGTIAPGSGTTIGAGLFFQVNNNTSNVTLEVVN